MASLVKARLAAHASGMWHECTVGLAPGVGQVHVRMQLHQRRGMNMQALHVQRGPCAHPLGLSRVCAYAAALSVASKRASKQTPLLLPERHHGIVI